MAEHTLNLKATIDTSDAEAKLKGLDKTGGVAEINAAASSAAKSVDNISKQLDGAARMIKTAGASTLFEEPLKKLGDEGKALADGLKQFRQAIAAGLSPFSAVLLGAVKAVTYFADVLVKRGDEAYKKQLDEEGKFHSLYKAFDTELQNLEKSDAQEGGVEKKELDLQEQLEEAQKKLQKADEQRREWITSENKQAALEAANEGDRGKGIRILEEGKTLADNYKNALAEVNKLLGKIAEKDREEQVADLERLRGLYKNQLGIWKPDSSLTDLQKFGFNMGEVEDDTEKLMQDQIDIQRQILDITRRIEVLQQSKGNAATAG